MLRFLGLTRVPDPYVAEDVLYSLQGLYKNETLQMEIEVRMEAGHLLVQRGPHWVRKLIPKCGMTFYLPDLSVEITFAEDKLVVGGLSIIEAWTEIGTEFVRV